jgi:hypothetical protein
MGDPSAVTSTTLSAEGEALRGGYLSHSLQPSPAPLLVPAFSVATHTTANNAFLLAPMPTYPTHLATNNVNFAPPSAPPPSPMMRGFGFAANLFSPSMPSLPPPVFSIKPSPVQSNNKEQQLQQQQLQQQQLQQTHALTPKPATPSLRAQQQPLQQPMDTIISIPTPKTPLLNPLAAPYAMAVNFTNRLFRHKTLKTVELTPHGNFVVEIPVPDKVKTGKPPRLEKEFNYVRCKLSYKDFDPNCGVGIA